MHRNEEDEEGRKEIVYPMLYSWRNRRDIDARYTRTKAIQYFCGLFTVVVALAIHLWAAMHARLIRTQTEALNGGSYWYVGEKIPVLEKLRNQMQI
mgnify:CR=1 FL=1